MKRFPACVAGFFLLLQAGGQPAAQREPVGGRPFIAHFKFLHYSPSNGLGSSNVRKTIQDSKGFIWAATQDGLYRFTGQRFIAYSASEKKPHKLTGSVVLDMVEYKNLLWVINAYGGIDAIDLLTGNVVYGIDQQTATPYKDMVFWSLARDGGSLYIGSTKGLWMLNMEQRSLVRVKISGMPATEPVPVINKLVLDKEKNTLWLFCQGQGVLALATGSLKRTAFFPQKSDFVYDCALAADHSVYAGTSGGLRRYSKTQDTIHCTSQAFAGIPETNSTDIYAVLFHKRELLVSNKNHLLRIDTATEHCAYVRENRLGKEQDWTEDVFGISIDRNDRLWLSCQQGLAFSDYTETPFVSYAKSPFSADVINHTYSLWPYDDSTVYACAEDGFYRVNTNTGAIRTIDKNKAFFFSFADFRNSFIVSNDEGTYILHRNKQVPIQQLYPEFAHLGRLVLNSAIPLGDSAYVLGSQNNAAFLCGTAGVRK